MEEIESQIAKIQLGNVKTSNAYVFVLAEKAQGSDAELYVIAELPMFNPAAAESCESICLAIASNFRRAYRRQKSDSAFENAIAAINEELGKLAEMGQTQWVNRLNCILAVKEGHNFHIATCGKVAAFLLRSGEFTDISCSNPGGQNHPLKTFENYASGKIKLNDLLILSTTQLFNFLSMDRLLHIMGSGDFLNATQTIIQSLKENADPDVSFGVLLNLQVPLGRAADEEVDLENYIIETPPQASPNLLASGMNYLKTAFALPSKSRVPKVALPNVSLGQRIKNIQGGTKNLVSKGKGFWQKTKTAGAAAKAAVDPKKFKNYSPVKKFLMISVVVLLLAAVANIFIALHVNKTKAGRQEISDQLKAAESLLANAQGSVLYKDDKAAASYFQQAKDKLPQANQVDSSNKALYDKVLKEFQDTETEMEKNIQLSAQNLGSLGAGENLIDLPNYLGVEVNGTIVSYNKQTGKIEDNVLSTAGASGVASAYISGNIAALYDGSQLLAWDFSSNTVSPGFSQNVPAKDDFAGIAGYSTNNRVYVVDKKNGQIINFAVAKSGISKPVVAARDSSLSNAIDMAIDGNIYVLSKNGITKFASGKLADFAMQDLAVPFTGSGKIYTQKGFNYIYLLDSGNNRVLILDNKGTLVNTIRSDSFTQLKDLVVDEKNKTLYVLNDTSLLKLSLP